MLFEVTPAADTLWGLSVILDVNPKEVHVNQGEVDPKLCHEWWILLKEKMSTTPFALTGSTSQCADFGVRMEICRLRRKEIFERKMKDNYVIKYDMAICPRTNFSFVSLADSLDSDSKGDGPNGILFEAMCEGCLLPLSPSSSRFYACVKCGTLSCSLCAEPGNKINWNAEVVQQQLQLSDSPQSLSGMVVAGICSLCPCGAHPNDRDFAHQPAVERNSFGDGANLSCIICAHTEVKQDNDRDRFLNELYDIKKNRSCIVNERALGRKPFMSKGPDYHDHRVRRMVDFLWFHHRELFEFSMSAKEFNLKKRKKRGGEPAQNNANCPGLVRKHALFTCGESMVTMLTDPAAMLECSTCGRSAHVGCLPSILPLKVLVRVVLNGDYRCSNCITPDTGHPVSEMRDMEYAMVEERRVDAFNCMGMWATAFGIGVVVTVKSNPRFIDLSFFTQLQQQHGDQGSSGTASLFFETWKKGRFVSTPPKKDTEKKDTERLHWQQDGYKVSEAVVITVDQFDLLLEANDGFLRRHIESRVAIPSCAYVISKLEDSHGLTFGAAVDEIQREREPHAGSRMTAGRMKSLLFLWMNDHAWATAVVGNDFVMRVRHQAADDDVVGDRERRSAICYREDGLLCFNEFKMPRVTPPASIVISNDSRNGVHFTSRRLMWSSVHEKEKDTLSGSHEETGMDTDAAGASGGGGEEGTGAGGSDSSSDSDSDSSDADGSGDSENNEGSDDGEGERGQEAESRVVQKEKEEEEKEEEKEEEEQEQEAAAQEAEVDIVDMTSEASAADEDEHEQDNLDRLARHLGGLECGTRQWATAFDGTLTEFPAVCRARHVLNCLTHLFDGGFGRVGAILVLGGINFFGSVRTYTGGGRFADAEQTARIAKEIGCLLSAITNVVCDGLQNMGVHLGAIRCGSIQGVASRSRERLIKTVIAEVPTYLQMSSLSNDELGAIDAAVIEHCHVNPSFVADMGASIAFLADVCEIFDDIEHDIWGVLHTNQDFIAKNSIFPIIPQAASHDAEYDAGIANVCAVFGAVALHEDLVDWRRYGAKCLVLWHEGLRRHQQDEFGFRDIGKLVHGWLVRNFDHRVYETDAEHAITSARMNTSLMSVGRFSQHAMFQMVSTPFEGPLVEMQVLILVPDEECEDESAVVAFRRTGTDSFTYLVSSSPPRRGFASYDSLSAKEMREVVLKAMTRGTDIMYFRIPTQVVRETRALRALG